MVKVRGFCESPGSTATDSLERLSLDVSFEPFHDALFHAWYFSRSAQMIGSPIAVPVPVDPGSGLNLLIEITHTGDSQPLVRNIKLSTDDGTDTPKLRAGHYFISLQDPGADDPDWGELVVQYDDSAESGTRLNHASSEGDGARRTTPFLVLAVDFPGEEAL
jgi:hypothetical protein